MAMEICLNIGCGTKQFKEFAGYKCINVDMRKLKGVDVIANVEQLPFKAECINYIIANDVIEHFPISQTQSLLKEWNRALKKDCILEIRCPDLSIICENYVSGKTSARVTSWLLYGGQDYDLNFHYVGFDNKWLGGLFKKNNFDPFGYTKSGTNMILKGRKIK